MLPFLQWSIMKLLPSLFGLLDNLVFAPGVSILSFVVALAVIVIVIGAILFRV